VAVSDDQAAALERYYRLLAKWNARINLTSLPLDEYADSTLDRLLLEPLLAARYVKDSPSTWFDLGSGGGSPAIPLKVMRPRLRLAMVESKGRKAAFLRETVRTLDLDDTVVFSQRIEDLAADPVAHAKADLVTLRAVRIDEELIRSARTLLRIDGHLLFFVNSSEQPPRARQFELMGDRPLVGDARLLIWAKRP
jgi:16S rRNA (guanine527-N7)-methyltransferase